MRTRDQPKIYRFADMLWKRSEEAKKHPEKLVPIEDVSQVFVKPQRSERLENTISS